MGEEIISPKNIKAIITEEEKSMGPGQGVTQGQCSQRRKRHSVDKQEQNTGTFSRSIHTIVFVPSKSSISAADVSTIWVCAVH